MTGHALLTGRTLARNEATMRRLGPAVCQCGAWSAELPSDYQRRQWHQQHLTSLASKGLLP